MDSIIATGSELGETVSHTASGIAASAKAVAMDMKKISADKMDAAADKASDIKKQLLLQSQTYLTKIELGFSNESKFFRFRPAMPGDLLQRNPFSSSISVNFSSSDE